MTTQVRTRFAPSPTGALHLGNVRIAVFNWLFARHHGGAFVLRIEDTDLERGREGSEEGILDDLRWLGLDWDEGPDAGGDFGPYRQTERLPLYRKAAEGLVAKGGAYRCYCTEEELEAERETMGSGQEVLRYSGRCRRLTDEERKAFEEEGRSWSIRFAAPESGEIHVSDEIRGAISFPAHDIPDFIILRSDGRPTYNFGVVVDDVQMKISHVLRGAGHLSNTPKQALLFRALDEPEPVFAHLPMVLSPEGGKLSKREGAAAVSALKAEGYHPDGVVNYLSLLGWSSPDEQEVLSREELIRRVTLDRLGASDTMYDAEKLLWLSGQHIARMSPAELSDAARPHLDRPWDSLSEEQLRRALQVLQTRIQALAEVNEHLRLLHPAPDLLSAVHADLRKDEKAWPVLDRILLELVEVEPWTPEAVMDAVRTVGKELNIRGRSLFHPVRAAVTGVDSGPDLGGVIWAIGREETAHRIRAAGRKAEV